MPPGAGLPGALADVAIQTQNGALIMRYRPHPAGMPLNPQPAPRIETLADGVTGFQASYLGHPAGKALGWTQKWTSSTLPILVRLHIELADGRDWPDLIVAPVVSGN